MHKFIWTCYPENSKVGCMVSNECAPGTLESLPACTQDGELAGRDAGAPKFQSAGGTIK
jgi:hypothetical protein